MSITINAFATANSDLDVACTNLITQLVSGGQYISGSSATGLCKYLLSNALSRYGMSLNQTSYGSALAAANAVSGSLVSGSFAEYGV